MLFKSIFNSEPNREHKKVTNSCGKWFLIPCVILLGAIRGVLTVSNNHAASNPLSPRIYVTGPASEPDQIPTGTPAFVNVVDAATLAVIKRVPIAEKPHHFYKVPYKNKALISHFGGTSLVEVFDLVTNTVLKTIPTGNGPRHLTFAPDGSHAWTANFDGNSVTRIDTTKEQALWSAPVGSNPNYVEPAGNYIFTPNLGGNTLTALNAITGAFVKDVTIGLHPFNISVSCDGKTVMAANRGSNDVSFVDVATLRETARVSIMGPISTAQYSSATQQRLNPRILPDCKYLWVGNQASGVFAVVDIAQRKLVAEVRAADSGGGSDIIFYVHGGPSKGLAIGTNRYRNYTTVINPNPPFNIVKQVAAGLDTHNVTFDQLYSRAYVSNRVDASFSVYDMKTLTELARVKDFQLNIDQAIYVWFSLDGRSWIHTESGAVK